MAKPKDPKPPTNGVPTPGPHDYVLRGADLFFNLPDGTNFHIHSHFFTRESKYWRKQLTGDESPGDRPLTKGDSAAKPYTLDDIGSAELRLFIGIFYNPKFGDYSHVTLEEWMIILKYAHKWGFPRMKDLAIRYLENDNSIDVARRIVLYQDNHLPGKYLVRYFRELVYREDFLSLEEYRTLGIENIWHLQKMREETRVSPSKEAKGPSPLRKNVTEKDVDGLVVSTLKLSLNGPDTGSPITEDRSRTSASQDADKTESIDQNWEDIDDDFDDF